jgi:signal transduction histidine kinase
LGRELSVKDIDNATQLSQVIAANLRMLTAKEDRQQSMDNLKYAQDILVEQAKLAALGNLVAGLAHEVNTPLGDALTASSITSAAVFRIGYVLQSGTVSRRTLMEQIGRAEEGGTGFGLYIVQNRMRGLLKGDIFVKSQSRSWC